MNFVVAFMGEAQPIIDFYQLKKTQHTQYSLYQNDQHSLVISGLSRENASTATRYLGNLAGSQNLGWINIGVAGHGNLAKGEVFICGKIEDDQKDECFYPPQVFNHSICVSSLTTCSKPAVEYEKEMGYDMEAHAFYNTASQFSIRELVQVIKIVSDNPSSPLPEFNPKDAPGMIGRHLRQIDGLIGQMEQASASLQPDAEINSFCKKIEGVHRFSVTRSHQLHQLVRQAKNLRVDMCEIEQITLSSTNAKEVVQKVAELLKPYQILG